MPDPAGGPAPDRHGPSAREMVLDWLLWAVLRLALVAIIAERIPWPEQVNDLQIYADWARGSLQSATFPQDPLWQYPPLAGPVMLLGWWLPGERLGFVALFLAADAIVMALLSAQARRTRMPGGIRLWALLPLVVGPLVLARFDVVPTALAVAAVLLATRAAASGALAAAGAWVKVWPILVLSALARRDLPRGLLGALGASAVIGTAFLLTTSGSLSFVGGQRDRGLQIESLAAWPFLVARLAGAPVEVLYRYGAHEVQAPGVQAAAAIATAVTVMLLCLVAVQRLRGRLDGARAADVALATVLFSVVGSRVFSGQYFIWLLGLAAVCLGDPATRMRRTTWLLVAAGIAAQLVYPWLYSALLDGNPIAVLVQGIRVGLMVAATVVAVLVLLRTGAPSAQSVAVDSPDSAAAASGSPPSSITRSRAADRSQPQDDSTH
jgi:hypothetical protein